MGAQGYTRVMKYVLVAFNVALFISGIAALAVGAWALGADFGAENMQSITGTDLYTAGCGLVIFGGIIIIIISVVGVVGVILENKLMLGIYFGVMLAFLIIFTAGAIVAFFFQDTLQLKLEDQMKKTLLNQYGEDAAVTDAWDFVQKTLLCCGVSGGIISEDSWFLWQSSAWVKTQKGLPEVKSLVPSSCCNKGNYLLAQCQKINPNSSQPIQTNPAGVSLDNPALYEEGCVDKLKDEVLNHIVAIAVIAVLVLAVLVTCIILSICVCMNVRVKRMIL